MKPLQGYKKWIGEHRQCPECGADFIWGSDPNDPGEYVIYDLETTGLSPYEDDIIQIAAIRFTAGQGCRPETFFSFAKPRHRISAFIESYTGISNQDVIGAPRPHEVLSWFSEYVGNARLIAHNGNRFDAKFLSATCLRHRKEYRTVECIDSIALSKRLFGGGRGSCHNLDIVLERLSITPDGIRRHDARGDVSLLARAVSEMWNRLSLDPGATGIPKRETHLPLLHKL